MRCMHQVASWRRRKFARIGVGLGMRGRGIAAPLVALVALVPILLAGCSIGSSPQGHLASSQVFTWPYYAQNAADPNHPNLYTDEVFDPAAEAYLVDEVTVQLLFTTLLTFNSSLQLVPNAAISMPTVSADGMTYTFHLRPNMAFSDGTPLTARDFAYSFNRALDPNLCAPGDNEGDAKAYPSLCAPLAFGFGATYPAGSPNAGQPDLASSLTCDCNSGYLGHLVGAAARAEGLIPTIIGTRPGPNVGVIVVDSQTLEIRIDKPIQYFLDTMTFPTSSPVEQKLVDAYPGGMWVRHLDAGGSSGPFMVQSYGNGSQLTLVPNPYWEKAWNQTLTLSAIVRPAIGSLDTMYGQYDRGGLYDFTDVPLDDYSFAQSQSDFHELASLETDFFGLSGHEPPFDNLWVRQAFDLALNKQYIVDTIEQGGALPTNHIVPKGMPGYDSGLVNPAPDNTQSITGNQGAARALLAKAQADCGGPGGSQSSAHDYCAYITGAKPLPIKITYQQGDQTRQRIATDAAIAWSSALAYQANGSLVSLNVEPSAIDGASFGRDLTDPAVNDLQAWIIGWIADYPDPQDFTTLQFKTGVPSNEGLWSIPGFDSIVDKADVDPNLTQRMSEYNQAEQLAVNYCGWVPFQQEKLAWRIRSSNARQVVGFTFNALDIVPQLSWPQVAIWVGGASQ